MIYREIEKKVTGNSLLLRSSENESGYEIKMFLENRPEGFLNCTLRYVNGEEFYVYDVTGMESLSEYYEHRTLSIKDIMNIFNDLSAAFSALEEYLLSQEYLRIEPVNIFYDLSGRKYHMCFFPKEKRDLGLTMEELADFMIQRTDYRDEEAIRYAYDFYKGVVSGVYSIPKINPGKSSVPEYDEVRTYVSPIPDKETNDPGSPGGRSVSFSMIFCSIVLLGFIALFTSALFFSPDELSLLLERTDVLVSITLTSALCAIIPFLKKEGYEQTGEAKP
ncbi:MAG: DUF6382 domain-containing protein [Lachnospiraceae bacterium]|nr:DUF6382 domain-containing protein [Lachnospiraceae bacterium]